MFATVPDTCLLYFVSCRLVRTLGCFAFVVGCAVLAAVAFGLAPALQTDAHEPSSARTRGELLRRDQSRRDFATPSCSDRWLARALLLITGNLAAARSPTPPVARRGVPHRRCGSGARATGAAVAGARAPGGVIRPFAWSKRLARGIRRPVPAGHWSPAHLTSQR